jgi:hypothetical protein
MVRIIDNVMVKLTIGTGSVSEDAAKCARFRVKTYDKRLCFSYWPPEVNWRRRSV